MTTDLYGMVYPVPVNGPFDERYLHEDIKKMSESEIKREWEQAGLAE